MANVTFSSPVMPRDLTVYAVAGHRGSLLGLAKEHKIPMPFHSEKEECDGSCLIEVKHLSQDTRYAIALTETEKEMLRQLGKITPQEVMDAEVNDMPPRFRLACQYVVRNEDIVVCFEGDKTLPSKGPALSIAAGVYKGGISISTVDQFLSYAIKVEEDAAIHFERLASKMQKVGNNDVAGLFAQLGRFSRLHLEEAQKRAKTSDAKIDLPSATAWPDQETPERSALWAADPALTRLDALKAALQGERRGYEFYYAIAGTATDRQIKAMAQEFVKEEAEHVEKLRQWIVTEEATLRASQPAAAPDAARN